MATASERTSGSGAPARRSPPASAPACPSPADRGTCRRSGPAGRPPWPGRGDGERVGGESSECRDRRRSRPGSAGARRAATPRSSRPRAVDAAARPDRTAAGRRCWGRRSVDEPAPGGPQRQVGHGHLRVGVGYATMRSPTADRRPGQQGDRRRWRRGSAARPASGGCRRRRSVIDRSSRPSIWWFVGWLRCGKLRIAGGVAEERHGRRPRASCRDGRRASRGTPSGSTDRRGDEQDGTGGPRTATPVGEIGGRRRRHGRWRPGRPSRPASTSRRRSTRRRARRRLGHGRGQRRTVGR